MKTNNARKTPKFEEPTLNAVNHPPTDEQRQDEFDALVRRAAEGDRRAIGAIAIAIGPTLLGEARAGLGQFKQDAGDVVNDFFVCLLERRYLYPPAQAKALPWMCGIVSVIARQWREDRERDWGIDGE